MLRLFGGRRSVNMPAVKLLREGCRFFFCVEIFFGVTFLLMLMSVYGVVIVSEFFSRSFRNENCTYPRD